MNTERELSDVELEGFAGGGMKVNQDPRPQVVGTHGPSNPVKPSSPTLNASA